MAKQKGGMTGGQGDPSGSMGMMNPMSMMGGGGAAGGGGGGGGMGGGMGGGSWIGPAIAATTNRMSKIEENERYKKRRARASEEMRWTPWTGVGPEDIGEKPTGPVATTAENSAMIAGMDHNNQEQQNQHALQQRQLDNQDKYYQSLASGITQQPAAYQASGGSAGGQPQTSSYQGPYSSDYYNDPMSYNKRISGWTDMGY